MLNELQKAIAELDFMRITSMIEEALSSGSEPMEVLRALRLGMEEVGRRFENREYFISELVIAGEMMKQALSILKPQLKAEGGDAGAKIVLGTIVGDLHDIGKEIVKSLLISSGFIVYDLGVDVTPQSFVEKVKETNADIVAISALLSTSIANTVDVIKALENAGLRDKVKVIIGGGAARSWMIEKYGVDAAVSDAVQGVNIIKKWAEER